MLNPEPENPGGFRASWLHHISNARSDGKLTANVSKAHARAENDTGNPSANRNALLCDACTQHILQSCSIQKTGTKCWAGRCGHKLWLEAKNHSHTGQANGGREDEAGRGAVNQVPKNGVREREGQRCLCGRFPRESPLWKKKPPQMSALSHRKREKREV